MGASCQAVSRRKWISLGLTHRNAESREPGHEYERSSTAVLNQGSQVGKQDERTPHRSWTRLSIWSQLPGFLPRIPNDSQEGKHWSATISKNPQWFARRLKMIRYDQQAKLQCKATLAKGHTRSPAIPRGPPRRSHTEVGEDCWPTRSSLTLPKWYLAT